MATDTRNKPQRADAPGMRMGARASQTRQGLRRWEEDAASHEGHGPFGLIRQMQDEVDRWFHRFGVDSSWISPAAWLSGAAGKMGDWNPAIDAFQRGNEFVIRADVPGMTRNDLTVEVTDDAVTIGGERKHEHKDEQEGVMWSERSYGSFHRVVPLPAGAISESAKATFNNGVLEIVLHSASVESRRGRRIDIGGHDDTTRKQA